MEATEEGITQAVKQISPLKALGPSMHGIFYKKKKLEHIVRIFVVL